jgi:hypothetical protein
MSEQLTLDAPSWGEKKANHRAPIVRIAATYPIEGADRIVRVELYGEQYKEFSFVSQKTAFQVGDLAVFIQPDSIVPATKAFEFVFQDYIIKRSGDPDPTRRHAYDPASIPVAQRRITVRRFKKQWSEGLLMPLSDFDYFKFADGTACNIVVGDDFSDRIGIKHYDADHTVGDESKTTVNGRFIPRKKRRLPRSFRGWVALIKHFITTRGQDPQGPVVQLPEYDVENFKNYSNTFEEGEIVHVTEKIHGSSARFVALDGVFYAGSRKQWVDPTGSSYPAEALTANPWIETWCRRNEGYALYGEVTPRQKGYNYDNAQLFGTRFWLFDIRDPQGNWLDKDDILYFTIPQTADMVPLLYHGPYHKEIIDTLVEGKTTTRGHHIREGIVIVTTKERKASRGRRAQLKLVSLTFLDKDKKLTSNV